MGSSSQSRSWVFWLRMFLCLLVAAGFAVTVLPAFETNAWWIRMLDFPRPQFLLALAVLLTLPLALTGRLAGPASPPRRLSSPASSGRR